MTHFLTIVFDFFVYLKVELVYTAADGSVDKYLLFDFKVPGVAMGMYNTDESIRAFAHSSFQVRTSRITISQRPSISTWLKVSIKHPTINVHRLHCKKNGLYTCLRKTRY